MDSLVGPAVKASTNEVAPSDAPSQSSSAEGFDVSMNGKLRIIKFNKPLKKNALSTDMYSSFAKVNVAFNIMDLYMLAHDRFSF